MKNHFMLAKQGIVVKILQLLIQFIFLTPLFFLVSVIITTVLSDKLINEQYERIIRISLFIVLNLMIIIRNCFIIIRENEIDIRDIGGGRQKISIEGIHSVEIINSKQLRNIILKRTPIDPLTSNCLSFIIPIGYSVKFKDMFNRDIIISVWNTKKLYDFLKNKESENYNYVSGNIESVENVSIKTFKIKLDFNQKIKIYAINWTTTILFPMLYSATLFVILRLLSISLFYSIFIALSLFIVYSLIKYYDLLKIVLKTNNCVCTLKFNCFNNTQFGTLNFNKIKNLHYVGSYKEFSELLKMPKLIKTPITYNGSDQIISFELNNGFTVLIKAKHSKELFNVLDDFSYHE